MSCFDSIYDDFVIEEELTKRQLTKLKNLPKGNYAIEYFKNDFNQGKKGIKTNIPENRLQPEIHKVLHEAPYIIIKEQNQMNNQNYFYKEKLKLNFNFI